MSVILKKKPQGEKPFDFRRVETAHDKDWFMPDREPKQKKAEVDGNKNSFDLGQMSSSCQHDLSHVGLTCIMLIPHCSKWELGGDRQVTPYCNVRVFIVPSFQKARYPPGTNIIKRCCASVLPIPSIMSWIKGKMEKTNFMGRNTNARSFAENTGYIFRMTHHHVNVEGNFLVIRRTGIPWDYLIDPCSP